MIPWAYRQLTGVAVHDSIAHQVEDDETDGADAWIDPPKCRECKGTGRITLLNTVEECPECLGSGY